MRNFCAFPTCRPPNLAPTLHQACNVQVKQKPSKPMKLTSFGFFTLILADTLALSQLTLTLPESVCVLSLSIWSTLLFWRSLLS